MARRPRIIIPGWAHHVTQRGNHRQCVFFRDEDRVDYLRLLKEHFVNYQLSTIGYCLMSNHIHCVVIPPKEEALSCAVGRLHQDFSRLQNIRLGLTGHLWQNRFFSCPVQFDRIWEVLAYVELNPVRARLVEHPSQWPWSSAQAHLSGLDKSGVLQMDLWQQHFDGTSWAKFLESARSRRQVVDSIRAATSAGRFWGSKEVARELERLLGRPVRGTG